MTNPSFHLFQLQKLDLRIRQIDTRLAAIDDSIRHNAAVQEASSLLENYRQAMEQKNKEIADLETAANAKSIKIQQSESSLYSGTNKTPKELSDLQKEIASLRSALSSLEEQQFSRLTESEELNSKYSKAQEHYDSVFVAWQNSNQSLVLETENLNKEKEKLLSERNANLNQIAQESISLYEKLLISKNQIAVTSVEEESCTICGAEITAADIQKARSSMTLITCHSCGRILYTG